MRAVDHRWLGVPLLAIVAAGCSPLLGEEGAAGPSPYAYAAPAQAATSLYSDTRSAPSPLLAFETHPRHARPPRVFKPSPYDGDAPVPLAFKLKPSPYGEEAPFAFKPSPYEDDAPEGLPPSPSPYKRR